MPRPITFAPQTVSIDVVAEYHNDAENSPRSFFVPNNPALIARFFNKPPERMTAALDSRILETEFRSSFVILSQLDAAFMIDFNYRCGKKLRDPLSRHFRLLKRKRGNYVRLSDDVMSGWQLYQPEFKQLIGDVKGTFHYRHWLAHGRYAILASGHYDYEDIYNLAQRVLLKLPLLGR